MDEKQKSSSTEKSIAQAYAAYMMALAARKHGPDKPEIPATKHPHRPPATSCNVDSVR
jgi:hypothetical protein